MWRWDRQEPFGNNVPDENPSGLGMFEFPLRFPGQYADKESGLFYNGYRDYDPALGGYARADPLGNLPYRVPSQRLNHPYAYANVDPLKNIDPLGLCPCSGGMWDQEFGDWQVELAFGVYGSTSRVNYSCRSNPQLKCTGSQSCIGGGLIGGGALNWNIRGSVSNANTSANLGGWSGAQFTGGAFFISGMGAWGQQGGNVSAGPGIGGGYAPYVRCYVFALQCTCPPCP